MAGKSLEQKAKAYGSSELLAELNLIVSRFTREQCIIAKSSGFGPFTKPVHEEADGFTGVTTFRLLALFIQEHGILFKFSEFACRNHHIYPVLHTPSDEG
jgi:hypothetical protein